MKFVIIHGDGMAAAPLPELDGKTPLQAAATPNMDLLASQGELGRMMIQADGFMPGSDLTQLAVLGYDPRKYHEGPAPWEATSLGVSVGEHDIVFCCNMVTLRAATPRGSRDKPAEIKKLRSQVILDDDSAGGIELEEARELIDAVNEQLGSETIQFYPGSGSRHFMVWVGGTVRTTCWSPHEVVGQQIGRFLPTGDGSDILRKLMEASLIILRDHPVNDQRREAGLKPVHCLWLWGQGRAPRLPSLTDRLEISGAMVSSSDLHRGIGICAGLEGLELDAVARNSAPEFSPKGDAAVRVLQKKDLVYVHAPMPLDVLRRRDTKAGLRVLEDFDKNLVGTVLDGLRGMGAHRLLLMCDYSGEPGHRPGGDPAIPYVLYEGPGQKQGAGGRGFSEADAEAAADGVRDATKLIARLCSKGKG
ncbi:MAG: phosphoglycerate mutase [Nitrospiraceae bacterium]